jgi:NAD(P)-dependent dehydrogenase (short-subunit alcohol dehydrogenase family)
MGIDLTGKVVIITGGAKGIGEGCVRKFVEANATISSFDLDSVALGAQAKAYENLGAKFTSHVVDVSKEAQVKAAIDQVIAKYGRIDALVNCAGIQTYGDIVETSEETWDKTFNVNVKSMFLTAKHVAPTMIAQKSGSIVNISSVQSLVSQKTVVAYSASKGGIVGMTLPMARDLAGYGIRVVSIMPGLFETPMMAAVPDDFRHALEASVPFPSRLGKPDEYALMARSIIENDMLNGTAIRLDGALRMQPK